MKYLFILLLVGGLTGDRPQTQRQDPVKTIGDEVKGYSRRPAVAFNPKTPLKEIRVQKCKGTSVFETATVLVQMGYHNPYTGENCGIDIFDKAHYRWDRSERSVSPSNRDDRRFVNNKEGPIGDRDVEPTRVIRDSTLTFTKFTKETRDADTLASELQDDCWRAFIRYMGVADWRNAKMGESNEPDFSGILRPVENTFIPNSRWENIRCQDEKKAPRPGDFSDRRRRYIGPEAFVLDDPPGKGKSDDARFQEIIDYVDSKVSGFEGKGEQDVQSQMRTSYQTQSGMVDNQGTYRQGRHSSNDTVTLSSGEAVVNISTAVKPGRSDQSFLSAETYGGRVWTLDTLNQNTYHLIPLSGTRFKIISSDSTDAETVYFNVEGD